MTSSRSSRCRNTSDMQELLAVCSQLSKTKWGESINNETEDPPLSLGRRISSLLRTLSYNATSAAAALDTVHRAFRENDLLMERLLNVLEREVLNVTSSDSLEEINCALDILEAILHARANVVNPKEFAGFVEDLLQLLFLALESKFKLGLGTHKVKPLRNLLFTEPLAQSVPPGLVSVIGGRLQNDAESLTKEWLLGAGCFTQEVLDQPIATFNSRPGDLDALARLQERMEVMFRKHEEQESLQQTQSLPSHASQIDRKHEEPQSLQQPQSLPSHASQIDRKHEEQESLQQSQSLPSLAGQSEMCPSPTLEPFKEKAYMLQVMKTLCGSFEILADALMALAQGEVQKLVTSSQCGAGSSSTGRSTCGPEEVAPETVATAKGKIQFNTCTLSALLELDGADIESIANQVVRRLVRCIFSVLELPPANRHALRPLIDLAVNKNLVLYTATSLWIMFTDSQQNSSDATTPMSMGANTIHAAGCLAREVEEGLLRAQQGDDSKFADALTQMRNLKLCAHCHLTWLKKNENPAPALPDSIFPPLQLSEIGGMAASCTRQASSVDLHDPASSSGRWRETASPNCQANSEVSHDESEDIPSASSESDVEDAGSDLDDFIDTRIEFNSYGLIQNCEPPRCDRASTQPAAVKRFLSTELNDHYTYQCNELMKSFAHDREEVSAPSSAKRNRRLFLT